MLKGESTVILALAFLATLGLPAAAAQAPPPVTVSSPDGKIVVSFELKSNPQPYLPGERAYYRVSYDGKPVLSDSPLGLDLAGARPLDQDFEIVDMDRHTHDGEWTDSFGTRRNIRDHYNQLRIALREREAPRRRVELIFRAYNGGVAFRYFLPVQPNLAKFTLMAENTGFYFAQDATAFALNLGKYNTSNEGEYARTTLDQIKPESIINLPLLVHVPNGPWVGLLEADLTDYAGMYVGSVAGFEHALTSKLSPAPDRRMDELVIASTPKPTPWRVLLMSPRPGGLIENNYLILNLNPPCALSDTSWIEPGKAAWDWWSGSYDTNVGFTPGMNTATMEHYIDFAATHHLQYMLIDAGWSPRDDILHWVPQVNIPEILAHAKQKGVKVILWVHSGAVRKQIDQAFPLYEKWGVAGVKIDFMDRDDQEMVDFYEEMVRKAAQHHLVVDFHGAYKPTGLRRTYPNLLTREGVMGMEYSKWSDRVTPEHDVTIPFTRMLAGPMDYTPGCFNNATREQFKARNVAPMCQGTRAHQLAMYVVFASPLVMLSDYPEDYDNKPGMKFLEQVPTVWDETRVVSGEPAQYVSIARRKGDTWYLGSMTNWDDRDLDVPLDFLTRKQYEAQIYADGSDADKVATSLSFAKQFVKPGDTLHLHLASGGGAAVILTPEP
jgi:alpha-glucosidase